MRASTLEMFTETANFVRANASFVDEDVIIVIIIIIIIIIIAVVIVVIKRNE